MDVLREFLEDLKQQGLAQGHFLGLVNLLIGRFAYIGHKGHIMVIRDRYCGQPFTAAASGVPTPTALLAQVTGLVLTAWLLSMEASPEYR